ncbi:phospholipase D [Colletotrichum tofieldiae]|uniref:Phospholipase D n=1 Tax=Colletotrichum tofieldiae TaxID=708197 RepID=A0A166NTB1_9PEZI|nr:phospholipase D [Colletotrichum tofieldiae]GKT67133.1 phospholipase D [Colletotrichum tofieldiae]GKT80273.1 phospholipase D [Colletotrichum tofieldiae]GKT94605.1 phospholipase D [Colletotrichum tofieldiae]
MSDMTSHSFPSAFLDHWIHTLKSNRGEQLNDFPNYHVSDPETLVTTCSPKSLTVGNGATIYRNILLPAILTAKHEVILVTCFWAPSDTLTAIKETLELLAERRQEAIRTSGERAIAPLRVRICFSSRSFFQKIFHPWSRDGYAYPTSAWPKLGLPPDTTLKAARIELSVKSLFFLPFSVMHPKFVIVDRKRAWMPSCNVSWETWFEGCIGFEGAAVAQLVRFYAHVWEPDSPRDIPGGFASGEATNWGPGHVDGDAARTVTGLPSDDETAYRRLDLSSLPPCPTIILPSSHHWNPGFRYIPLQRRTAAPATPLNAALLSLFACARTDIDIVTPNLTCRAVVDALLDALRRGVDVRIRTSKNMMLIEQLVTACTTTEWTLQALIKRYSQACAEWSQKQSADTESQLQRPGRLDIYYYRPNLQATAVRDPEEPVVSHLKMTLVDREYLCLGSGNLDRASWYTSQELGILLHIPDFKHDIWSESLESRIEVRFSGGVGDILTG